MYIVAYNFVWLSLLALGGASAIIPSRGTKMGAKNRAKHLELIWKIHEEMDSCDVAKEELCGSMCLDCEGVGALACRFCGGTGFLMLGGDLIGTNNDCPVCSGVGEEECKECMGAGNIVMWRKEYDGAQ